MKAKITYRRQFINWVKFIINYNINERQLAWKHKNRRYETDYFSFEIYLIKVYIYVDERIFLIKSTLFNEGEISYKYTKEEDKLIYDLITHSKERVRNDKINAKYPLTLDESFKKEELTWLQRPMLGTQYHEDLEKVIMQGSIKYHDENGYNQELEIEGFKQRAIEVNSRIPYKPF